jgi:hypothetical protein
MPTTPEIVTTLPLESPCAVDVTTTGLAAVAAVIVFVEPFAVPTLSSVPCDF